MPQFLLLPSFKQQLKKIGHKKHLTNLTKGVISAGEQFLNLTREQQNSYSIGHYQYKIRIGSKEQGIGKRSGFRILIVLAIPEHQTYIPYAIYSKNEYENLPLSIRNQLLSQTLKELKEYQSV